jgi:hypothetical protein
MQVDAGIIPAILTAFQKRPGAYKTALFDSPSPFNNHLFKIDLSRSDSPRKS